MIAKLVKSHWFKIGRWVLLLPLLLVLLGLTFQILAAAAETSAAIVQVIEVVREN